MSGMAEAGGAATLSLASDSGAAPVGRWMSHRSLK